MSAMSSKTDACCIQQEFLVERCQILSHSKVFLLVLLVLQEKLVRILFYFFIFLINP